jgi:aminoglycoside phosphotransferase (APT) family kinase protein
VEAAPAAAVAWAEEQLGAAVVAVERMAGGIDAQTFRLVPDVGSAVVLRITEPEHHEDIDYLARVLNLLDGTPVPAPRPLAHVLSMGGHGPPVMLQSLLPGDPTIPVEPDEAWLGDLAATIVRLQQIPLHDWMHDRARVRWADLDEISSQELSSGDRLLVDRLRECAPSAPFTPVFGHDDFWAGNTLRDGSRVVGIVDWGHAGVVSAARDLTYLAVDTSICYGLDVGDTLIDVSAPDLGAGPDEMLVWSARSVLSARFFSEWLTGWNGLGAPVTHEQAARRRTELLDRTLARLG